MIRLGKVVPGKCLLRNQIVNNSSLAASFGVINIPLQHSKQFASSTPQKRTLERDAALELDVVIPAQALSKPLCQSFGNVSSSPRVLFVAPDPLVLLSPSSCPSLSNKFAGLASPPPSHDPLATFPSPGPCLHLILSPIAKPHSQKVVRSLFGQKKTSALSRGAFNIFSQPPSKASRKKSSFKPKKLRGNFRTAIFTKSNNSHLAKILQEEEVIEEDLKAGFMDKENTSLPEGETSPFSNCLLHKPLLNLSSKLSFPSLISPLFESNDLDLPLDQDAHNLLQNVMIGEEDQDAILDTPLAMLYSQIKEKKKLGIHQNLEGLEKPDFGSSPPKKGRKSFIEVRT